MDKKLDILYIVGSGSKENNEELKYSLRSVDKFCKGVDRVFITGICRNFINKKKVIFTSCDDPYCRSMNHFYKVYTTFMTTDISDDCLLMYDDIFFCSKVDIRNYPSFYKGKISDKTDGAYGMCLFNTKRHLTNEILPCLDFGCHTPIIYNRNRFIALLDTFEQFKDDVYGISPRCLYGNKYIETPTQLKEDVKIRTNRFGLDGSVKQTHCFSTGDFTYNVARQWLYDNFMWKSRWEK